MTPVGGKMWFSAAELAELELPGIPRVKRKVNELADAQRWKTRVDGAGAALARPRGGRGGGLEFHRGLLPAAAQVELARRGMDAEVTAFPPLATTEASLWPWFERQSDATKAEARRRARIVAVVEMHERGGLTRSAAIALAAADHSIGGSTLWGWLAAIEGTDPNDRLPHLAPRRRGGGAEAACDEAAWTFLISDYLRPEKPTFSSCYARMVRDFAQPRGLTVPCERTLHRRMERMDARVVAARRQGADALRATIPPQQRTVAQLHALELVNIDGHKWDVFVRFPDGKVRRPITVAIQDVYSRRFVAWRFGETEDIIQTRLAFGDLFRDFGIPKGCLLDNGRAFASKAVTGGAKTRFRFKIRDEEPTGFLTALGIAIHWATPYRGSSKPIERGFRDLCDTIAKHPAFAGAYTGNKPDAKPENYGDRAIPLEEFVAIASRGIRDHNAKTGRTTEMCRTGGLSFDQAFERSYAVSPIGRATPEQLRMALLTADEVLADRRSGAVTLLGNRYWSAELAQLAGKRLTVRFDPDDLLQDLHVYAPNGEYLLSAPLLEATGFLDLASAKKRARQEAELRRAVKRQVEIEGLIDAAELAKLIPASPYEPQPMQPSVVRPVRHRGATAAALKPRSEATERPLSTPYIDRLAGAVARLRAVD